jgi:hypothetical protein
VERRPAAKEVTDAAPGQPWGSPMPVGPCRPTSGARPRARQGRAAGIMVPTGRGRRGAGSSPAASAQAAGRSGEPRLNADRSARRQMR